MPIERVLVREGQGSYQTVKTGNTVYIMGQTARDESGKIVGEGDIVAQLDQIYKNIERLVGLHGGTLHDIVKTTTYITDRSQMEAVGEFRRTRYGEDYPTSTSVIVTFPAPGVMVEIEAIAYIE